MSGGEVQYHKNSVFEFILEPVSVSKFLNDYWGSRPLEIRGTPGKFSFLTGSDQPWDDIDVSRPQIPGPNASTPKFEFEASFDGGKTRVMIRPEDAGVLYAHGASIVGERIELIRPELADAIAQIRREIYFLGDITFRFRAIPSKGMCSMRYDSSAAIVMLVKGSGVWTYANELASDWPESPVVAANRIPVPGREGIEGVSSLADCSFNSVEMANGDAMSLPAGCWHEVSSKGGASTLELVFSSRAGFYGSFEPALRQLLRTATGWRAPLPPLLIDELDPGAAPANVHAIYQERLQEALALLDMFRKNPDIIDQAWSGLAMSFSSENVETKQCTGILDAAPDRPRLPLALAGVRRSH